MIYVRSQYLKEVVLVPHMILLETRQLFFRRPPPPGTQTRVIELLLQLRLLCLAFLLLAPPRHLPHPDVKRFVQVRMECLFLSHSHSFSFFFKNLLVIRLVDPVELGILGVPLRHLQKDGDSANRGAEWKSKWVENVELQFENLNFSTALVREKLIAATLR